MPDLQFVVPSGIGDISWIYSKVNSLAKKRSVAFSICKDLPNRSKLFVDLLPNITNLGYERNLFYWKVLKAALPSDTKLGGLKPGRYILTLNPHLESGKKLSEAYPDQPTDYHYDLKLPAFPTDFKFKELIGGSRRMIGIYCSSYQHHKDTLFWKVDEWVQFLMGVKQHIPGARFVVVGATYDNRTNDVFLALKKAGEDPLPFLDQEIGFTFQVLKCLDYFFAFPSGLGIMADVLNIPAMMWFWGNLPVWAHMKGLFDTYADPEHTKSKFHLMAPYASVSESLQLWVDHGLCHVKAREVKK